MKKVFILGLAFLLLAGLLTVACKNVGEGNVKNLINSSNETENETEVIVGDFSLTISVEETTLQQGQDIEVIAVFKNQSGKRHNISRGFLRWCQL